MLKHRLEQAGVTSEMLDNLVHDAASRIASRVNNEGMSEQIEFIESAGITETEIADELNIPL
ncbi:MULTISPECIES: hypothetical protein [Photorhabdus]|uniref:Uncharacterized protein n=1 Tax=Photorhabdus khanii subsp. guanajuatensis TaxID=2100166 RepID=A0A4R4JT79_9GAMM|nr:hypothetical protein [Photorhabdus khanii]KGM26764.1 hypothetical protein KS18_18945 [Photorhabdus luminescens]TDB57857.1 hypothetical protein C5467_10740 [Photorhabdus khanii subsp. guanajuatensis]